MYGPLVRGWTQQLLWSVDSGKNDSGPVLGIALNWLGLFHSLPFGTLTHDTFPLEIQAPCCEKPIHMKGPLDVIQVTAPIEHSVPSHGDTVLDVLLSLQVSAAPPQSGCNHMYVCVFVTQLCPTLCDPMDCSLPGSYVHGILQARLLEWVAIPFSRESSRLKDWTQLSCMAGRFFTIWETRRACSHMRNCNWASPGQIAQA